MRVRGLDSNHDWVFGTSLQSYIKDEAQIGQMIKTRILSFLGDCFFSTHEGIDWFNLLGTGSNNDVILEKNISLTILKTDGVIGINTVDLTKKGRGIIIKYDVKTIFSSSYQQSVEVVND